VSLDNFDDLKTAIAEWLYRAGDADLSARADDFIALFEADFLIDPQMRTLDMEEVDTTPVTSATDGIQLPTGYIDMIRLRLTGLSDGQPDQPLSYVSPAAAATLDSTQSTSGIVKWYTVMAGEIFLAPLKWAPVGASLEMAYYAFTGLANAAGGVNWLLQKYPNLYLYGSLMQAAAYVDDAETVAKWKAGRDEAMSKLSKSLIKRKLGAGPLAIGASTNFVR
jgi:predicted exporter